MIGPIQIDYYSWCWQFNGCVKDEERCMILHPFRTHGATVTAEQMDTIDRGAKRATLSDDG